MRQEKDSKLKEKKTQTEAEQNKKYINNNSKAN